MGDFDKFLDNIATAVEAVTADTEPAPPPVPEDPLAQYIGRTGPIVEESPFDAFLDQVCSAAPADLPVLETSFEDHDWKAMRQTIYEEDHDVWRCERCFRQINVQRNETIGQALEKYKVYPACGEQIAADVQES